MSDSYRNFVEHRETHTFSCEVCDQKCMGAKSLKFHMKSHGKKQEVVGEISEETSNRAPCNICGVLILFSSLESHISQVWWFVNF